MNDSFHLRSIFRGCVCCHTYTVWHWRRRRHRDCIRVIERYIDDTGFKPILTRFFRCPKLRSNLQQTGKVDDKRVLLYLLTTYLIIIYLQKTRKSINQTNSEYRLTFFSYTKKTVSKDILTAC